MSHMRTVTMRHASCVSVVLVVGSVVAGLPPCFLKAGLLT